MKDLPRNLALLFLTSLLLLSVLECVVRILPAEPGKTNFTPVPETIRANASFPDVPYVLKPGATVVQHFGTDPRGYFDPGATLTYRTNSLAFRGPETTRAKPPRVFRIVGLGDSFTFGTGVRDRDTFLRRLESSLNLGSTRRRYEVLNLGVMGYDTMNEVSLFEHRGMDLAPDLVVICFFLNDTGAGASNALFTGSSRSPSSSAWWRHSRLLEFVVTRIDRIRTTRSLIRAYRRSFRDDSPRWIQAREALCEARVLSESVGARLILLVFPVLWHLSNDYPFSTIHETVDRFAKTQGIPTLDLLSAFDGFEGPELWVHPSNQHPNERAHAVAAETLLRFLRESGILPAEAATAG